MNLTSPLRSPNRARALVDTGASKVDDAGLARAMVVAELAILELSVLRVHADGLATRRSFEGVLAAAVLVAMVAALFVHAARWVLSWLSEDGGENRGVTRRPGRDCTWKTKARLLAEGGERLDTRPGASLFRRSLGERP